MEKLEILVAGEPVPALTRVVSRRDTEREARVTVERLKKLLPAQQFVQAIQAKVGGRIIARETVKAKRKDVIAKCYGGDVSRKRKLLDRQKEGKKRMKQIGRVEVPQEAFVAALRLDD